MLAQSARGGVNANNADSRLYNDTIVPPLAVPSPEFAGDKPYMHPYPLSGYVERVAVDVFVVFISSVIGLPVIVFLSSCFLDRFYFLDHFPLSDQCRSLPIL